MLSIVVPIHNGEHSIHRIYAVREILAQKRRQRTDERR